MKKIIKSFISVTMILCTVLGNTSLVTALASDSMNVNRISKEEIAEPYSTYVDWVKLSTSPKVIRKGSIPHYAYGMNIDVVSGVENEGLVYVVLTNEKGESVSSAVLEPGERESLGLTITNYKVMAYTTPACSGSTFKISVIEEPDLVR